MSDAILRERVANLLTELTGADNLEGDDHTACLRHLGVAALNLATEVDAEALVAAGDAVPWAGIYLQWHRREDSPEEIAELIDRYDLVDHLDAETVRRRLARSTSGDTPSSGRCDDGLDDTRTRLLCELAEADRRIETLTRSDAPTRRDTLLDDPELLALALAVRAAGPETEAADTLASMLPDWTLETPSRPLEVLARFEASNFEEVPAEMNGLGQRARRFEQSMATHLKDHGLLAAVRAALAITPPADQPLPTEQRLRSYLTNFSKLASNPGLLELTVALVEIRRRPVAHLRGAAPLADATCWVEYLRGPCAEFARNRDISRREATNFAHYALHLIDICELAGAPDVELDDPIRKAVMDVEDELKEFALAGQREEPAQRPVDLHRYDRSRWRNQGRRAHLANRLSRLCGAWRSGHRPGPPGTGARPDSPLVDKCQQLVAADDQSSRLDAADNLLYRARLTGAGRLESWSPRRVLSLVTFALQAARRAGAIDVDVPFVVDVAPLVEWLEAGDTQRRIQLVEMLLELRPDPAEPACEVGLTTRTDEQMLHLEFSPSRQLEALLTLLATTDGDEDFADQLRQRLSDLIEDSAQPDEPDQSDQSTSPDPVRRPVPSSSPETDQTGHRLGS